MRRRALKRVVVGVTAAALFFAAPAGAQQEVATISGTVTDGVNPVEFVEVCAGERLDFPTRRVCDRTDANGDYTITDVPEGWQTIDFFPQTDEFDFERYDADANTTKPIPVFAKPGVHVTDIDATLVRNGFLTGVVAAARGLPMIQATVCTNTRRCASAFDGTFEIAVPEGIYDLTFWAPGNAPIYLHDIFVASGQSTAINETMTAAAPISGTITNDGTPISGARACATGDGQTECGRTGSDGRYLIDVGEGEYVIDFSSLDYFGEPVTVETSVAAPASGTDVELTLGHTISGFVADDAGNPLAAGACAIGQSQYCVLSGQDGLWEIAGLPAGEYVLRYTADGHIREYNDGAFTEKDMQLVDATEGDVTGLTAMLTRGGEIAGTVTSTNDTPIVGIKVCAIVLEDERGAFCDLTSIDGTYGQSWPGTPAGSYVVFAWDPDGAYQSIYFGRTSEVDQSPLVEVKVDETTVEIDFVLETVPLLCNGLQVTVDLSRGQLATDGDDVIRGTAGADLINGRNGNDTICGLQGDDVIDGGDGFDKVYAGAGDDLIDGGSGNDRLVGGIGHDTIIGGNGNDRLQGGAGDDKLSGGNGKDRIAGNNGNDILRGGKFADRLFGNLGRDQLFGDEGDDVLRGGAWVDAMDGGGGSRDGCTLSDAGGLTETRVNCEGGVFGR